MESYALQRLAEEHPERYHIQIMRLFCAFVRNPTGNKQNTRFGVIIKMVSQSLGRGKTFRR